MNKLSKFASSLIITSLIISPISGIIYQNNHIAKAEKTKRKVIKKEILSIKEHKEIINSLYQDNIISESKKKELESLLQDRAFSGYVWVQYFSDGAKDVHIPGWIISVAGGLSFYPLRAVLSSPRVATFLKLTPAGITYVVNQMIQSKLTDAFLHGLVVYSVNPRVELLHAGSYYYYDTVYDFHHLRIDY